MRGHEELCVAAQLDDPDSFLNMVRSVVELRHSSPALRRGTYGRLDAIEGCIVFERAAPDDRRLVALNLTEEERSVEITTPARIDVSTTGKRTGEEIKNTLVLAPLEGCIARGIR